MRERERGRERERKRERVKEGESEGERERVSESEGERVYTTHLDCVSNCVTCLRSARTYYRTHMKQLHTRDERDQYISMATVT